MPVAIAGSLTTAADAVTPTTTAPARRAAAAGCATAYPTASGAAARDPATCFAPCDPGAPLAPRVASRDGASAPSPSLASRGRPPPPIAAAR